MDSHTNFNQLVSKCELQTILNCLWFMSTSYIIGDLFAKPGWLFIWASHQSLWWKRSSA